MENVMKCTEIETLTEVMESRKASAGSDREIGLDKCTFDFTKKSWSSDFTLVVEGTKLFVAKNILALASPVFYGMFHSGFQEGDQNEVDLPGKSKSEVIELLRCIYPNSLTEVSQETALMILPLAEEYQVMHVKTRCEKALLTSLDNASTHTAEWICKLLKEACLYNLKDLRATCINFASEKSQEELECAYRLHPLPADAENEILVKVNLNLRRKISDLQKSNAALSEEIKPLKNYFIGELNPVEGFPIAEGHIWKEKDILFILDVDKMESNSKKSVTIWNSIVSVSAKQKLIPSQKCFPYKLVNEQWLNFEITFQTFSIQANHHNICLKFVFLSRISRKENLSFRFGKELNGNQGTIKFDLKKLSYIKQKFARDGKLALLVQVYLSKPK